MRFTIRDLLWLMVVISVALSVTAAWRTDRYFLVQAYRGARTGYIFEYSYANRLYRVLEDTGQKPPKRWPRDNEAMEAMKSAAEQAASETPRHTRMVLFQ